MSELGEKIRFLSNKLGKSIERKIFGPSVMDRDFPDLRFPNEARDKMQIAKIIGQIRTKKDAMRQIANSTIGTWTDYDYRAPFHEQVKFKAISKAEEFGATEEEIDKAIHDANISGATMRSGMED